MDLSAIGVPDSIVTKVSVLGLTSVNRLPWKACDELGWKYIFDHSGLNLGEFTLLRNTVIAWNELYPPEKPSIETRKIVPPMRNADEESTLSVKGSECFSAISSRGVSRGISRIASTANSEAETPVSVSASGIHYTKNYTPPPPVPASGVRSRTRGSAPARHRSLSAPPKLSVARLAPSVVKRISEFRSVQPFPLEVVDAESLAATAAVRVCAERYIEHIEYKLRERYTTGRYYVQLRDGTAEVMKNSAISGLSLVYAAPDTTPQSVRNLLQGLDHVSYSVSKFITLIGLNKEIPQEVLDQPFSTPTQPKGTVEQLAVQQMPPNGDGNLAVDFYTESNTFTGDKVDVLIDKVEIAEDESLVTRFGVSGYPAGSLDPELNEDARESLLHFVTTKTSTKRNPDGLLEASAGRLESLDAVIAAAKHMVSDALLAELQTAVDALQGTDAATGKDYIATAKKVLSSGGAAYVTKELKHLDSIIAGKSVLPEMKSAFQLRRNLLAAFQSSA